MRNRTGKLRYAATGPTVKGGDKPGHRTAGAVPSGAE